MKKVCFISQCSLPIPTVKGGAVETLIEYIIDENEKKPSFEFTVISIADRDAEKLINKYKYTKFIYIPLGNKNLNKFLFEAARVLKHAHINLPSSIEFNRALHVLEMIGEQDLFIYEAGPTTHLALLKRIIPKEKLAVHLHWEGMGRRWKDECFSYLIPVSDYIGKQWRTATGCKAEKVSPLFNCTKIERFMKQIDKEEVIELRESLKIRESDKVIIFTGRIVAEKGVKELLEAYAQINRTDLVLVIIGSANFGAETKTKYEIAIARLIAESKKHIIFTGYVHQTQLYKYYAIADIAVMPSLFQDPAPLVCIEAQATGTPLIATRVGGIPEYVGKNGAILIEQNDCLVDSLKMAIEGLLDDERKRFEMARNEIANASEYTTEKYFENFKKLMDKIIV